MPYLVRARQRVITEYEVVEAAFNRETLTYEPIPDRTNLLVETCDSGWQDANGSGPWSTEQGACEAARKHGNDDGSDTDMPIVGPVTKFAAEMRDFQLASARSLLTRLSEGLEMGRLMEQRYKAPTEHPTKSGDTVQFVRPDLR